MADSQNHQNVGGRPRLARATVRSALGFWRTQRGITQQALSDQSGVRADRISRYESGDSIPTYDELQALSKALGVTIADLYSDDLIRVILGASEVA